MSEPLFHEGDKVVFTDQVLYGHAHGGIYLTDEQEESMRQCIFTIRANRFDARRNLWGYDLDVLELDDAHAKTINDIWSHDYIWDERELALWSEDLDVSPELTDITFLIGGIL